MRKNWTVVFLKSLASWIFVRETKTGRGSPRSVRDRRADLKTAVRWYADLWHKDRHLRA